MGMKNTGYWTAGAEKSRLEKRTDLFLLFVLPLGDGKRREEIDLSPFGDQMKKRGKHGSVIAAAIGNRWIRSLFQDMRSMGLADLADAS